MSPSIQLRTVLFLSATALIAGCATEPEIDPADLPPQAMVDDGIDYYSSTSETDYETEGADELLSYNRDQWSTDEDGNRIYHLNQLPRGQASRYYVGDIRYNYVYSTNRPGGGSSSAGNTPVVVSRSGWPLHSETIRGSRGNTYYQTRRGRIDYLPPAGYRSPPTTNTQQGTETSSSSSSGSTSSGNRPTTTRPRPTTTTPPRPPRRSSPPAVSRPDPSPRQTDKPRRPDR